MLMSARRKAPIAQLGPRASAALLIGLLAFLAHLMVVTASDRYASTLLG